MSLLAALALLELAAADVAEGASPADAAARAAARAAYTGPGADAVDDAGAVRAWLEGFLERSRSLGALSLPPVPTPAAAEAAGVLLPAALVDRAARAFVRASRAKQPGSRDPSAPGWAAYEAVAVRGVRKGVTAALSAALTSPSPLTALLPLPLAMTGRMLSAAEGAIAEDGPLSASLTRAWIAAARAWSLELAERCARDAGGR